MRLGLVIYGSLSSLSGGYLYDRQLVEYLRAQGDSVDIISMHWRNYARHLTDNLSAGWIERLRAKRYDVLLQDELNHPSLVWLNARLKGRYPIISIVHHLRSSEAHAAWKNRFYRWVEAQYLRSVDGFVFNSMTTRHTVEALSGTSKPYVIAYPAGDRFQPNVLEATLVTRAHETGPLRLVFVGNIIPRKGLHTVLSAIARLPHSTVQLTVVGRLTMDVAYARAIQRQIIDLGLQDRVTLRGALDDGALAEILRQSQVLVGPSSYEGFGIVYLEGMAFGLPAIATTVGAASELITPNDNGFLITPEDAVALAAHLHTLHTHRDQLAALSLRARQRFLQHPTWRDSMAKVRQFLSNW